MYLTTISDDERKHIRDVLGDIPGAMEIVRLAKQAHALTTLADDANWLDSLEVVSTEISQYLVRFRDTTWRGWANAAELAEMQEVEAEASDLLVACGRRRERLARPAQICAEHVR